MSRGVDRGRTEPEPDEREPPQPPAVRFTVQSHDNGCWSAWRNGVLVAGGLPTITAAWDALDQIKPQRADPTPTPRSHQVRVR